MEPTTHRVRVNGVELCVFEWGRPTPDASTLLLAHATGFHARCWDSVVAHLGDRHVVALDQRGHGRSDKPAITDWHVFGSDLAEVIRELDLRDVVGIGHSMGGHAMTNAAAECSGRFRRLVLIDPVIAAPDEYSSGGWTIAAQDGEPHPTAKRKNRFGSVQEMIERFRDRRPYADFHPDALRDYCTHGLLPAPDGAGFVLACPPATEASIYRTSRTDPHVHAAVRALDVPVLILRAKAPPPDRQVMDFSSSPTWPGLVHEFRHGREIHLADRSHFIPLETPGPVARLILDDEWRDAGTDPDRSK